MNEGENGRHSQILARFLNSNPKRGNLTIDSFTPVVAMKKIKLGPSDASGLAATTHFLPELTDDDDNQDLESQRARREGAGVGAAQNEEVPFIDTLTQDELDAHVQKCLEMSSENKINQKNAFALKLIDCFSFLQKKKDFSAMACTLDAGTKIYSCRVDALHQQVVKLADEVVTSNREERTDKDDKDGESLAGGKGSTKEQRKARKNNMIASSESLKRQMKTRDPKDKYLRFEPLPGAILSGVRRDPSDLSLSLERYTPFWPNWENYKPLKAKGVVSLPDVKIFREKSQTIITETPASFPEADEHQHNAEQTVDDNDDDADHVLEENHISEICASNPPSEQCSDNDGETHSVTDELENRVSSPSRVGEDEVGVVSTAMDRLKKEAEADGAVDRAPTRTEALKILFDVSSEYDYLKMKNCNYWAGPEFWKRPQVVQTGSDKEKRKVSNKKKEPAEIVYDFQDLDERLLVLSKKGTSLSERVVRSWKKKKTTLPTDLKVDPSWFLNLFHVESCGETSEELDIVQKSTSFVDVFETFEEGEEITDNSTDPITDPFNSDHEDVSSSPDPLNSTFYEAGAAQSDNSEPRNPLESTFYDAGPSMKESGKIIRVEVASSSILEFGESYMVPAPKTVNVDPIKYSTRPIRVDMQHLKHAMLTVIREEIEKDASEKKILIVPEFDLAESKPGVRFRTVLKSLPRKLERRTREDVSVAIAFTALLSLANEYSLQLEKCDDGDFVVRFPDSPVLVSEEETDARSRFQ